MDYREYGLEIIKPGSKKSLFAYTDYPLTEDEINNEQKRYPLKKIQVIGYDRDKYCYIIYKGEVQSIKRGYCYHPRLQEIKFDWCDIVMYEPISHKAATDLPYLFWE